MLNKSRKIGGSLTLGGAAILWGLFGDTTTIVSRGQRESRIVLGYAKRHAKVLEALGSAWAVAQSDTTEQLTLATGAQIIALPATSGGRGFDGHIILDEFAYHGTDAKGVFDAAVGSATLKDHRIRVCSTPNGVGNKFHDLWLSSTYRKLEIPIEKAIAQGYPVSESKLLEQVGGDARIYDQLYRCKFLDGLMQYLPSSLIEDAKADIPQDRHSVWDGETYAGLDVGRVADRTCLVIVRVDRHGIHWVHHIETLEKTSEADLHRLVDFALGPHWRCQRVCIDATGLGSFPAKSIQDKHGHHRVELVTFTNASKEAMATTLHKRLADHALKIPYDARELVDDLLSIKRIITAAGNVRYDAPVTERGHADRAWALALALHACATPESTVTLT